MNALEMADPLQPAESTEAQRNECLSLLTSMQNADGGWGFRAGARSRVEPTCWAALSVFHSTMEQNKDDFRRLIGYLRSQQLEDGSWPASPEMKPGSWVTSLACCALAREAESEEQMRAGLNWLCQDFPRDSSPWMRFLQRVRGDSRISSHNDSYRGWGWTPRTASWVEPTAFALMALRDATPEQLPKNAANRQELAVSLLYDRMCPGGGWNCGNPRVYGVDGDSLVLPTCWALLALRDVAEKPGRTLSLAWLDKQLVKIESAGSLAVACMTFEDYGMPAPQAKRDLQEFSVEELGAEGTHVLAWVCMALDPSRRWPPLSQRTAVGAAR